MYGCTGKYECRFMAHGYILFNQLAFVRILVFHTPPNEIPKEVSKTNPRTCTPSCQANGSPGSQGGPFPTSLGTKCVSFVGSRDGEKKVLCHILSGRYGRLHYISLDFVSKLLHCYSSSGGVLVITLGNLF